ncbi:Ig heavy chain Mem5-like protein [Labeo rohita]|uniref:Ig heavy chain Mem5-like protein n=1 Tax=Labeo rohita TaxID=84645 RepID=A0A498MS73_LABRO|nr:Ig heavy chain Mem5-like protein [Labeo rohita]
MTIIFCAFFTLLTCVSGVTVLTQSPLITVSKEQTAKLDCNLGTATGSYARCTAHLHTSTPNHKMITIFCAFFTLLTCVSGVTVLTQSPLITVNKGQTAKLDCNLGTVTTESARWYKQTPGGVPQHVLRFRSSWSSVSYGSGFSAPKFTSTHSSETDYNLIINNVDVDDSAVYYCNTWDNTDKEEELSSSKVTLVCLINHMSGALADVRWLVNGNSVTEGVFTGSAEQQPDKKFKMSSSLTIERSEWDKDTQLTCEATTASKTTSKSIKKSDCSD